MSGVHDFATKFDAEDGKAREGHMPESATLRHTQPLGNGDPGHCARVPIGLSYSSRIPCALNRPTSSNHCQRHIQSQIPSQPILSHFTSAGASVTSFPVESLDDPSSAASHEADINEMVKLLASMPEKSDFSQVILGVAMSAKESWQEFAAKVACLLRTQRQPPNP
ncbi:hypothetical protein NEOLEDRAFT_1167138 [Neolentinus lepideus HHB14362 ss-1]|uniref:Uncharacterized protein n=1 Tax=Neolentinus lepideus HHB14362 ss-1 TaxID=1314782 RepID=A0A165V3P8_9AGAM|nr:hypothetical protein NEOLEDRAFT_1167138 [Neolentinus lepideus HHB14362 ss-1]